MALFENFPYTNFHELNLDWLLQKMKELAASQNSLEEAMAALEYYIHHLDLDDIVVETLNNMLDDGTLEALMADAIAQYETNIGNVIQGQNERIAVLEGRMDEFASLPDGSTAGNAELLDIRVDAWGDSWPSAGDSVRGQVGVLSDQNPANKIWPTNPNADSLNGLSWTWNGDGSLTISGTATATTSIYLNGETSGAIPNLETGDYLVQRWIMEGSGNVRFGHIENGVGVNLIATYDSYASAQFSQTAVDGGVYLQVGNGQTVNGTYRFMVSVDLGLDAPEYEPMVQHTAKDAVARSMVNDLRNDMDKGVKVRYITYAPGDEVQDANEALEILINEELLVLMVHTVNAGNRADVWRIAYLYKSDRNFTRIRQLTTQGEFESAFKLSTWSDFCGGYLHGHEFETTVADNDNPAMLLDGVLYKESDFTNLVAPVECKQLTFYEHTSMNSPADTTQTRIRHTKMYNFTSEGLVLDQTAQWNIAGTTAACYMAMLPMAKNRVLGWMDDGPGSAGFREFPQPVPDNFSYTRALAQHAQIGGIYGTMQFDVDRYPEGLTGGDSFLITDNSGQSYAKCYYVVCDGQAVSVGDTWRSRTVYKYHPDD